MQMMLWILYLREKKFKFIPHQFFSIVNATMMMKKFKSEQIRRGKEQKLYRNEIGKHHDFKVHISSIILIYFLHSTV
jgi:hypothetical protein